ncbi:MAG: T9SS C-terminal target domain-containing protein [Ignavibacteriales bacterium CG_4_9_14_3_um_filter_34_10]|nr:MAG: T9SS C-terminal target domain-containing protein [Ignavibacteriales bacterium CG_4_9_14_3_um_filter_34_10]
MKFSLFKNLILLSLIYVAGLFAQTDPMLYQRWNIMGINRVRTQFNNTGLLCDGNEQNIPLARPPSFEYPNGSGLSYGTSVGVVIGAPGNQDPGAVGGDNPNHLEYLDATIDEGSAAFWDEEHFAPYPEVVGGSKAAVSNDPTTWPQSWPQFVPGTNQPLIVGPEGWPGIGKNGSIIADQETYSAMYSWRGTDVGNTDRRWLLTNMEMRGFAWTGELYQDFIVWMFVIRNVGTEPIVDMRAGIHSDFGYLPIFMPPNPWGDDDRHYYDPALQFAYGSDDDFYEPNPTGGTLGEGQIAWSGTVALRMPGPTKKVQTYDAFHFWMEATTPRGNGASKELYFRYNLENLGDPQDSNKDGIDDDFNENGIPDDQEGGLGYYLGIGADGLQVLGSDPFTLNPGESDTLIFATVFGMSKNQLYKNVRNAIVLYNSGFKPVTAPEAPKVEIVAGDGKSTIYWNLNSEKDPKFEGYKIYRSADNGQTWGSQTFTDFEGGIHYIPLVQSDKVDGIKGNYRTLPEFAWYYLGSETGLPPIKIIDNDSLSFFKRGDTVRIFVDDNVINGLNYRYYIASYDTGNGITGPLENTPASNPQIGTNTVQVVPHAPISYGNLNEVKVVPNPYVVANGWEQGDERQIQFTHLPSQATIRIMNTSGDLIRTIYHDQSNSIAPSIAKWDLKNENQQLVAPGLYFYHVESSEGNTSGKFIIIL